MKGNTVLSNRIDSSLATDHFFNDGYVGKEPVPLKDTCIVWSTGNRKAAM